VTAVAPPVGSTDAPADPPPDRDAALATGIAALQQVSRELVAAAERFEASAPALDLLLATSGRVAVTGLGKSGLVGAKLAATLASTGTPAFFVHAADALHGDAGMVTSADVLLAISNSGGTTEVVRFAEVVHGRGVPVVAMTGCGGGSPLCRLADAAIDVAVARETDPYDLVPTASTTVTAAVGDALAVALMVARGFGPDDFHRHHSGGALGTRLTEGDR
jgi:arabinose-5-phosphate isomerase